MDPSCTIGFLCSSLEDFSILRAQADKVLAPPLQKGVYPFFSFSDKSFEDVISGSVNMHVGSWRKEEFRYMDPELERQKKGKRKKRKQRESLDDYLFVDDEDFIVVECASASASTSLAEEEEEEEEDSDPLSSVDGFQLT